MKLVAKIIITGKIKTLTGLHIGGSKSSMEIGGVDLNVIKTPNGAPYIPGSSLKGKLRSLSAREKGSIAIARINLDTDREKQDLSIKTDADIPLISEIYGIAGDMSNGTNSKSVLTRLYVRDAFLDTTDFDTQFKDAEMEFDYSDVKIENRIDRKRGSAKDPRQIERVPSGARFDFEMVYNVYNDDLQKEALHIKEIKKAMRLLQMDYIGGHGSRGYGKITFEKGMKQVRMTMKDFEEGNVGTITEFIIN